MRRKFQSTALGCAIAFLTIFQVAESGAAGSGSSDVAGSFFSLVTAELFSSNVIEVSEVDRFLDLTSPEQLQEREIGQDTTLILTDPSSPVALYLGQNTPNPMRVSTSIDYGLPRPSWVKISIHTMLGTEIRTIVNEPQKAGHYSVQFSDSELQPGIYFYRIETDYGLLTRRMSVRR